MYQSTCYDPHATTRRPDVIYPARNRYTLRWLEVQDSHAIHAIPNNRDATFKRNTKKPKPLDLLLLYNYGAAAAKRWGHGTEVLQNFARPSVPVPTPTGPPKTAHDKTVVVQKFSPARSSGGAGTGSSKTVLDRGIGRIRGDSEAMWDEDGVMLFFWGNSSAAKERHLKTPDENIRRMEQWRGGVPQASV